jgi:membrane-associated HD superfamily phosphohydrolase
MTAPPRIAAWLLEWTLAPSERDALAGDLYEEFVTCMVPARGVTRARWWYRWQVARSLAPLLFRSWERASLTRSTVGIASGAAVATLPATLLVMLRSFVLQQVPLKTTPELSAIFAAGLASVVLLAGLCGVVVAIHVLHGDSRQC